MALPRSLPLLTHLSHRRYVGQLQADLQHNLHLYLTNPQVELHHPNHPQEDIPHHLQGIDDYQGEGCQFHQITLQPHLNLLRKFNTYAICGGNL